MINLLTISAFLVCGTPYDIHLVFYMYAYQLTDTGKGIKAACLA